MTPSKPSKPRSPSTFGTPIARLMYSHAHDGSFNCFLGEPSDPFSEPLPHVLSVDELVREGCLS